jgi:hypothetical protein
MWKESALSATHKKLVETAATQEKIQKQLDEQVKTGYVQKK